MPSFQNYKDAFSEIAKSKGYIVHSSSYIERQNNIDLILEGQNGGKTSKVSIDIKKKNGKSSNSWVWLEYQTSKGKKGWIYGAAQFIVFETSNSFIFVNRQKLLNFLSSNSLVAWDKPYVEKAWSAKYRLYRRPKTLEIITQIKVSDIMLIPDVQVWTKL